MASLSLRQYLVRNQLDPAAGVRHLIPPAVQGSVRWLLTPPPSRPNQLHTSQQLVVHQQLASSNGLLNLILQSDGNLVLYRTQLTHALWASNTVGQPVEEVIMQNDGNLVAYTTDAAAWATATDGHPGAYAYLQDDGNFVVYDSANNPLWASNTVQNFGSPTFEYTDASGYLFDETSEGWKSLCGNLPCFAAMHWPGYDTNVVPATISGQAVIVQLWKGTCGASFGRLPNFPGGIGAEVGVYRKIPGRARPSIPQLTNLGVPLPVATWVVAQIAPLTDNDLWWPFPELGTTVSWTLTNPVNNTTFTTAGPENTYWMNKWMDPGSYAKYQSDHPGQTPGSTTQYILSYTINDDSSFAAW